MIDISPNFLTGFVIIECIIGFIGCILMTLIKAEDYNDEIEISFMFYLMMFIFISIILFYIVGIFLPKYPITKLSTEEYYYIKDNNISPENVKIYIENREKEERKNEYNNFKNINKELFNIKEGND